MLDNGPQYSFEEFRAFAAAWKFRHIISSPTYSQSNGLAENGVKTVKRILQKSPNNYFKGLLAYRASTLSCGQSPAQLLMKRRIKTTLPIHLMLLKGENDAEIVQKKMNEKLKQKHHYHRTDHDLPTLYTGQDVCLYDKKLLQWQTSGRVLEQVVPRSYKVQADGGGIYCRNKQDLKTTDTEIRDPIRESVKIPTPSLSRSVTSPPAVAPHTNSVTSKSGEGYITRSDQKVKHNSKYMYIDSH